MMGDDPKSTADKIRASLAANKGPTVTATAPSITGTPAPGFRFATGDQVIDLVSGNRGTIGAWYQSATNSGPVYEIRIGPGAVVIRLEKEIERDGARNIPPFLPRV